MQPLAETGAAENVALRQFLEQLADPSRPPLDNTAVVVAHPDDETIGCGVQLSRVSGPIVLVTDGAPRDLRDARSRGFDSAEAYAAARRRELQSALAIAGVSEAGLVLLGVPDQQAAHQLAGVARNLAEILASAGTRTVMTHAYEGGHPDHDATAFAVHAAVALAPQPDRPTLVVEMPYYRLGSSSLVFQSFVAADSTEVKIDLSPGERAIKQRMIAAHASQKATLWWFRSASERFRAAPRYDFTALPNGGLLAYAQFEWGMTGARWCELARAAQRELGLEGRM
jgi:LmbE family N-acetylglucosaminyl deacetylase